MSDHGSASRTLAALSQLTIDVEAMTDAHSVFTAVANTADLCIGHKLLTVLRLDPKTLEVERLYTTNPTAYPTQGTKPMRNTWWGEHVLIQGQPYVGYSADDIRGHFADHEVILGLGLRSILNVPVRFEGRTLGTVNLLHDEAFYSEAHIGTGKLLGALLVPTLLKSL